MDQKPHDSFRLHDSEDGKGRPDLDVIFKAGANARQSGQSMHDNPYAAGSDERAEWDAGWKATADCDEEGAPGAAS